MTPPRGTRAFWSLALAVGLSAVLWQPVLADVKSPGREDDRREDLPPSPLAGEVSVVRGQEVEIHLRAVSGTAGGIEFLIRRGPSAGSLTEPVPLPRDREFQRAVVLYRSSPDAEVETDVFTYAARMRGGKISTAVPVTVRILDPVPRIRADRAVAFGEVMVGNSAELPLDVENVGTAPYRMPGSLPPPFELVVPEGSEVVAPGARARLTVRYTPQEQGTDRLTFVLGPDDGQAKVDISGQAVTPFWINPGVLRPSYDPTTGERMAVLTITNPGDAPCTIDLEPGLRLAVAQSQVAIEPGESVEIPVRLEGGAEGFKGELVLRWERYRRAVTVLSDPLPGRLELADAGSAHLEVPKVLRGSERLVPVALRNVGGMEAEVIAEASSPFYVRQADRNFTLPRDGRYELMVGLSSPTVGGYRGELNLYCGSQVLTVPMAGEVVASFTELGPEAAEMDVNERALLEAHGRATGRRERAPSPGADDEKAAGDSELSIEELDRMRLSSMIFHRGISVNRDFDATVPRVAEIYPKSRTSKSLSIGWQIPNGGGPYEYAVEYERGIYAEKSGAMLKFWAPFEDVEFETKGSEVVATVGGLTPGGVYTWRVLTQIPGVGWSMPSQPLVFGTHIPGSLDWKRVVIVVMGALVIAAFVAQRVRYAE